MKASTLITGALAFSIALLGAAPTAKHVPDFDAQTLDSATIPVLVPTTVPSDYDPIVLTAVSGAPHTKDGGYRVIIGARPDCVGGAACEFAAVEGEPSTSHRVPPGFQAVRLHDGSVGYYTLGRCHANCGSTFDLKFYRNGATYDITIKAGRLVDGLLIERGLKRLATNQ